MKRVRLIAAVTLTAVLSAPVLTGCSEQKGTSEKETGASAEQTEYVAEDQEAKEETSEEAAAADADEGKVLDPAMVKFDNLSSDATADLFDAGSSSSDFTASADYGYICPYFGERAIHDGSYGERTKFGFAKTDGTVICEPIFDYFFTFDETVLGGNKPYTYYEVGKGGKYGIINGSGSYYSGCEYDWVLDTYNTYNCWVVLLRIEGDEAVSTIYDAELDKVVYEDIRYPAKYLGRLYDPSSADDPLTIRDVIDEDHIILEYCTEVYLYTKDTDTLFPERVQYEDSMDDGVYSLGDVFHWVVPMEDDMLLVKDGPENWFISDMEGNQVTPSFAECHDVMAITYDADLTTGWPGRIKYAFFTDKEHPEIGHVYNTNGERVKDLPMILYASVLWNHEDKYYISEPNGKQGVLSGDLEPLDEYEEHIPDYVWRVDAGDVSCVNMNFQGYGEYESFCYALDIDPETADRDEVFATFDKFRGMHVYVFDKGELIFKTNSGGNDIFIDHTTGKHYVVFTEGEYNGMSMIEMTEQPDDHSLAMLPDFPDNMIYCIEDKKLVDLCIDSPFAQVVGVGDSHLVIANNIGGADSGLQFATDKKAYTEIYDISDIDDPKLTFHYSATDTNVNGW